MIGTAIQSYRIQLPERITAISPLHIAAVSLAAIATALAASAGAGLVPAGDGALHVDLSARIGSLRSLNTGIESHYPPLYHLLGTIGHAIAGPAGVQAISFVSFGIASLFTFLFVRQLTGSEGAALIAQALVSFSPVMLWYSSLTLMEPMLVAAVMIALYLVLRAADDPTRKNLVLVTAALAAVALTKQTGLPVVLASLVYLAIAGLGVRRASAVAVFVAVIAAGPYLFVLSQTGAFTDPGQIPVSEISRQQSEFPGSIMTGGLLDRVEPWSAELDLEVNGEELYARGTVLHEARKVYWRNILQWERFEWIHTLYPRSFSGYEGPRIAAFHWLISLSLVAGLVASFFMVSRMPGLLLVLLVLAVSYSGMSWGTDTKRLFLYVPVVAAVLIVLPYAAAIPHLRKRMAVYERRQRFAGFIFPAAAVSAVAISALAILPLLTAQMRAIEDTESTQGGGFESVGGVDSIAETGDWLTSQLSEQGAFVAASVYEWEYYSQRENLWDEGLDYRIYFLPPDRLDHYLKAAGADYVVVRLNQVIDDESWNHIELIPAGFLQRLEAAYPTAYTSIYGDIKVFEVSASSSSEAQISVFSGSAVEDGTANSEEVF